jgi:hypothetical protein
MFDEEYDPSDPLFVLPEEKTLRPWKLYSPPGGRNKGGCLQFFAEGMNPAIVPTQNIVYQGRVGTEFRQSSVPFVPYEYWIDDAGNVRNCAMATCPTIGGEGRPPTALTDDGSYRAAMLQQFEQKGYMMYFSGPTRRVMEEIFLKQADGSYKLQEVDVSESWPKHRDQLIRTRRFRQRCKARSYESVRMSNEAAQSLKTQKDLTKALQSVGIGSKQELDEALIKSMASISQALTELARDKKK